MRDISYEVYYGSLADAPLEGARVNDPAFVPELRPELQQYSKYLLRDGGLDFKNFEAVDVVPQNQGFAVIVEHDRRRDAVKPWCVRYRGSGRYFSTLAEAFAYCRGRRFQGSW
jgi:hypothetical protein